MVLDVTRTRSLRAEHMSTVDPWYWMLHVLDHQSRTHVNCGSMLLDVTRTRSLRAERMSTVEPWYWMIHVLDHSEQNVCLPWNHGTG